MYDYYHVTNYGKSWAGFNYLILSYGFSVGLCISPESDDISGFFVGGNLDVNYLIGGFLDTRARLLLRIAVADDDVLFLIGIGCKFGFDIRVSTAPKHDFE